MSSRPLTAYEAVVREHFSDCTHNANRLVQANIMQQKVASVKNACSMKWHPVMIKINGVYIDYQCIREGYSNQLLTSYLHYISLHSFHMVLFLH